jgi:hypothetical protein
MLTSLPKASVKVTTFSPAAVGLLLQDIIMGTNAKSSRIMIKRVVFFFIGLPEQILPYC